MEQERLIKIVLHGNLGAVVGKEWNLYVKSITEAMRAIEVNTGKIYRYLIDKDKEGIEYNVFFNDTSFEKIEELSCSFGDNINEIHIIPVVSGASAGTLATAAGAALILGGILLAVFSFGTLAVVGAAMIVAGIGLVIGGVMLMLAPQPSFDSNELQESNTHKRPSYFFDGPTNSSRQGGGVPILYGKMIVGSQVISASIKANDI